ncbi:MAG: long-chain-acyl-CoA synthetase [Alphaproteobacteria bacterium]
MRLGERFKAEYALIDGVVRTMIAYGKIGPGTPGTVGDDLEKAVDKYGSNEAFRCDGRSVTYAEFDALTNQVAHWGRGQGLKRGDVVALFAFNSIEFLAVWMGLCKIGVVTALINTNLTSAALAHCINIAGASHVIVEAELDEAYKTSISSLTVTPRAWNLEGDFAEALKPQSTARIPREDARGGMVGGALCLLVYTSGTTGAPKAARMPHWRVQGMMRAFVGGLRARPTDRNYVALPLYHSTGGLCAIGVMLEVGGCVIIRRRFSATHFWRDIASERATMFFYVGEMCRYLINQPEDPAESHHCVRAIVGNGLRPDVWEKFKTRFKIPKVLEFYGSTEGNVNMLNFDGKAGAVGRVPAYARPLINVRLVKFDVEAEAPVRGADGLCIEAANGEPGEALGEIRANSRRYLFEGYSGDQAQTNKKILRDVFAKGDAWFRTGDLLKRDKDAYFYFVDRIGDTYRWKGENVSTNQVAETLTAYPGVKEAIVYGVSVGRMEGRAGMASLTTAPEFNLAGLPAYLRRELPAFARPLFVRLQQTIDTTGTFKYRKMDLVREGFDPATVSDPLFFDDPETESFVAITPALRDRITSGAVKF